MLQINQLVVKLATCECILYAEILSPFLSLALEMSVGQTTILMQTNLSLLLLDGLT